MKDRLYKVSKRGLPTLIAQFIERGDEEVVRFHHLGNQHSFQMIGTFTKEFNDNWLEQKRKEGCKVTPFNKWKMRYYYGPMYEKDPQ